MSIPNIRVRHSRTGIVTLMLLASFLVPATSAAISLRTQGGGVILQTTYGEEGPDGQGGTVCQAVSVSRFDECVLPLQDFADYALDTLGVFGHGYVGERIDSSSARFSVELDATLDSPACGSGYLNWGLLIGVGQIEIATDHPVQVRVTAAGLFESTPGGYFVGTFIRNSHSTGQISTIFDANGLDVTLTVSEETLLRVEVEQRLFRWFEEDGPQAANTTFELVFSQLRLMEDDDGDGLPSYWEEPYAGVDGDGNGTMDLRLYDYGRRPRHKDLLLELDSTEGNDLLPGVPDSVANAFARAPVTNPDGTPGIQLHVWEDSESTPITTGSVWHAPDGCWPDEFAAIRAAREGSDAERADPNWPAIRSARLQSFRYAIAGPPADASIWGCAQLGGNEFAVMISGSAGTDPRLQAAAFMHELGHTLGLNHGGLNDNVNGKPNYVSLMNYALGYPFGWNSDTWTLDYSREALPTLMENALDETVGIPSTLYRETVAPYSNFALDPTGASVATIQLDGSHQDFNRDGDPLDIQATVDLNYWGPAGQIEALRTPSPGETMRGHRDWSDIRYSPLDPAVLPQFVAASARSYPTDELGQLGYEYINTRILLPSVGVDPPAPPVPGELRLRTWPNPARHDVVFDFALARRTAVALGVFDLQGRRVAVVASGSFEAGAHRLAWRAADDAGKPLHAGVYFARIESDGRASRVPFVVLP